MKVDVYLRESNHSDRNFIINSWLKSQRTALGAIEGPIYFTNHERLIRNLLLKSKIYMACNPTDLYQIYGWMVCENRSADIAVLHYIYVKYPYRRYGIGEELFSMLEYDKRLPCIATHRTKFFDVLKSKWNLTYNPYLLIGDSNEDRHQPD